MKYNIVGKYVKNIDFKIPNSKSYFLLEKNIKNYKINFDIKSKNIKANIFEIDVNLKLISEKLDENSINVSVFYSTLINVEDKIEDKKELEKIILVNIPGAVYPDIRNLLIYIFEKSGFKQISLEKSIDFQRLYEKN